MTPRAVFRAIRKYATAGFGLAGLVASVTLLTGILSDPTFAQSRDAGLESALVVANAKYANPDARNAGDLGAMQAYRDDAVALSATRTALNEIYRELREIGYASVEVRDTAGLSGALEAEAAVLDAEISDLAAAVEAIKWQGAVNRATPSPEYQVLADTLKDKQIARDRLAAEMVVLNSIGLLERDAATLERNAIAKLERLAGRPLQIDQIREINGILEIPLDRR